MTCSFTHQLSNGANATVVYNFVDEDETVGLQAEFEIEVYLDGLEITNVISEKDNAQIETEVAYRWKQHCEDERREADISRWESQLD
jgi:queuine/archaeosine tRNA-ribosyltransferase